MAVLKDHDRKVPTMLFGGAAFRTGRQIEQMVIIGHGTIL
jgi:hypothetical protein